MPDLPGTGSTSGHTSASLRARSARDCDLPFLDTLFAAALASPESGFTYPVCESAAELIDELRAYGLGLEQGMAVIERADEPIGSFGFLYEPKSLGESKARATAFLIGPMMTDPERPSDLLNAMLGIAEGEGSSRGLLRLRSCIAPANARLIEIFTQRQWKPEAFSLEMKLECGHDTHSVAVDGLVDRIEAGSPRLNEASQLLAVAFGWGADKGHRLQGYLDDGYNVAFVEREGELAGVAIWYGVAPFARIENIVVRADRRRSGIGSTLLKAAVGSLRSMGRQTVYLSLDPENKAARDLYRRQGFVETSASAVYGLLLEP
jgi:GNAT superfamily N-acetyltransferase